jgi:paraquat-inducible protein B
MGNFDGLTMAAGLRDPELLERLVVVIFAPKHRRARSSCNLLVETIQLQHLPQTLAMENRLVIDDNTHPRPHESLQANSENQWFTSSVFRLQHTMHTHMSHVAHAPVVGRGTFDASISRPKLDAARLLAGRGMERNTYCRY